MKDKVIVGVAGGDSGMRGYICAFSAKTGEELWRFYTVPAKGEPGSETWGEFVEWGGAATWLSGTYDPELNLLYWTTGNPWPDFYAGDRKGDNLYSCSVIALDLDTGKLKWHFQFTPHDTHDWDAQAWPVLDRHAVRGPAPQAAAARQSQRLSLCSGPRHWRVSVLIEAGRQARLGEGHRRQGPAHCDPGQGSDACRESCVPGRARSDELDVAVVTIRRRSCSTW